MDDDLSPEELTRLLADPAFCESVLYELEYAYPEPPRRIRTIPSRDAARIVDADPPARSHFNVGHGLIVCGVLLLILTMLLFSTVVGNASVPATRPARPLPPKHIIPSHPGSYSVIGKPTISANFINTVLATYHSPAAGKGQALYDDGVQYGIDPTFALAFFMHESSFGTAGEARVTKSLGNLRCIPTRPCTGPHGQGYAMMQSWEDGFAQWYQLIDSPLYRGAGLITVETIIPRYAPQADHNNEAAYIRSVEHAIATWRAGTVLVTG